MSIELTEQQQHAIDSERDTPPRVLDPRNNTSYYLVPASEYDAVREWIEDERQQKAIRATALHNAARRAMEEP